MQRELISGLQKAQGEMDAMRETMRCTLEDEKEKESPSPRNAEDAEKAAGTEGRVQGPADNRPRFAIPKGMPRSTKEMCHRDFSGALVEEEGADIKPMLLKRLYEKYCVSTLVSDPLATVIVGRERYDGCSLRHHIQSSDDVGVDADCDCPPGDTCGSCDKQTWIIVDMIERFTPFDIAMLLASDPMPVVYAVQYEYRAARGGLHAAPGGEPELRWERHSDGLWVEDDQHMGRYIKDPADWTRTGACVVGNKTLCWQVIARVGDCRVVRYHLVNAVLAECLEKDPLHDSYYGNTTPDQVGLGDPRSVELQAIIGPISKIYSAGEMFYCKVEDQQILVPKQGVGHIALWAAGKPRELRTYSDAYIQARQWLKTTKLSTLERADCIPYIVAFGLLRTLNTEAKAIGCLGSHAHAIALHNDMVVNPFAPPVPTSVQKWRNWFLDNQRWLTPLAGAASALATFAVGMFNKGKIVHTATAAYQLWLKYKSMNFAKANLPLMSLLQYVLRIVQAFFCRRRNTVVAPLYTYCAKGRELKETREGAKCKIRDVDVSPKSESADNVDCHVTEGPFHVGLGVTGFVPVIARHCVHNDLVAVRNRGICKRAKAEAGWWKCEGKERMFSLFGDVGPIVPTPRMEWLERYPAPKRRELEQALSIDVVDYYAATHRKAFTKTECAVKRGEVSESEPLGEIVGFDPRLIQGCLPEYVNATGPFAHAFSKACKGEHGNTTYGPGLNAEGLDDWLEMAESWFNGPIAYMDSDAVRLDASVDAECIATTTDLYEALGADEEALRMFRADTITHGATSCGVVYQVEGTVPSGKTTTTCGNTIAVITVVEEALAKIKHKAIVAGDDAAILVPLRLVKRARHALIETGKRAGFEFKVKASRTRCDMEFCSGRWWPAATRSGFAFGPKPGKLLPKLFFAATKNAFGGNPSGYCKAICEGMLATVSHLPVAREFVLQVYDICSRSKVTNYMQEKLRRQNIQNIRRRQEIAESPEIWEAYSHIYGLSRSDCQSAIDEIRKVVTLPDMVEHPVFELMVAQDAPPVGDPDDRDSSLLAQANLFTHLGWWASWATPFLEEWQRAKAPRSTTLGIIAVEAVTWVGQGNHWAGYIPAALLHVAAMSLHLKGRRRTALALHMCFNVGVAVWNWHHSRGRVAGGNCVVNVRSLFSVSGPSRPRVLPDIQLMQGLPQRQRKQRQLRPQAKVAPAKVRGGAKVPKQRRGRGRRGDQAGSMGSEAFYGVEPTPLSRQMGTSRLGGIRYPFHGDEEVANVNGGNTFAVVQYPINPGQAALFPWLSKEAALYERYVFTQLEFYYQTLLNATSATAVGKVVYNLDFDAADAPPASKQQAMDSEPSVSCAPWENMALKVPKKMLNQLFTAAKFVRPGGLPGGNDIKTYDLGNLNVVTDSNTATTALGELHVRYAGFFLNRVLDSTTKAPNNNQVAVFQTPTASAETFASSAGYQYLMTQAVTNGLSAVNTAGSVVLPPGNYLLDLTSQATATTLQTTLDIQKNGTSLLSKPVEDAGTAISACSNNASTFVSCNGTDAITVVATANYAYTGTLATWSTLRIVAV